MACTRERSESIAELAGGRLGADGTAELLEHLEGCASCSAELDLAADLVALGGAPAALRPEAAPRGRLLRFVLPAAAVAAGVLLVLRPWTDPPAAAVEPSSLASLGPLPYPDSILRGEEEDAERRAAMEHYSRGEYEAAAAALAELAARDPGDALARFYRGVALLQLGRAAEARAPLGEAAERGEGLLRERSLWYLANAALALEDAEEARAVLERLVALDGEYVPDARAKLDALRRLFGR